MTNLGVTMGEGVSKIQPPSVCPCAFLFLFLCIFLGTEANPGHRESRKAVQGAPDHHTPVPFFCFTYYVTIFSPKCGYKGCNHAWWMATTPVLVSNIILAVIDKRESGKNASKWLEMNQTAVVCKSLRVPSLELCSLFEMHRNLYGSAFWSSTKTPSKNSDGSRK